MALTAQLWSKATLTETSLTSFALICHLLVPSWVRASYADPMPQRSPDKTVWAEGSPACGQGQAEAGPTSPIGL